MYDRDFLIWLAGFFDGEGMVTIAAMRRLNHKVNYNPVFEIINTDAATLTYIHDTLGVGKIYTQRNPGAKPHHLTVCRFRANGRQALELARHIYPFVRTKRARLELILDFPIQETTAMGKGRKNNPEADDIASRQKAIFEKMAILNRANGRGSKRKPQP